MLCPMSCKVCTPCAANDLRLGKAANSDQCDLGKLFKMCFILKDWSVIYQNNTSSCILAKRSIFVRANLISAS